MREIVFDTETTGREPSEGDRIVEIGAIELINHLPTGAKFHVYLNPQRDVPEEVVRVHGLTTRFLSDKALFADVVQDFLDFIGNSPLVAHNAEFDRKFINAEFARIGMPAFPKERFIDTLQLAKQKMPAGSRLSLDALANHFQRKFDTKIDLQTRKGPGGHGALVDSRILAEVYLQLRGGRERTLTLAQDVRLAATDPGALATLQIVRRAARKNPLKPRLTAAESAAHENFIAALPNPIWRRKPEPGA
jgi:DNA polymerase-3 subunit epsilon